MRGVWFLTGLAGAAALALATGAAEAQSENVLINTDRQGLAIQGYDPVAFFTEGKPVKGTPEFQLHHGGGIYHFASEAHREAFRQDPAKYEPQFGGFCAWAVSRGYTASVEVATGQVVDGRLIFNYSRAVQRRFNEDPRGNLAKADRNWPGLVEKEGKAPS
ncbi:MAG TPA: YHS domain-containing (seleno)protein [Gemmatimonadales bacterium]|jgi:YHS domain-containing protein|nr:YHS domain-containing (seleno)protein [Gemmatimonadales bacterium]